MFGTVSLMSTIGRRSFQHFGPGRSGISRRSFSSYENQALEFGSTQSGLFSFILMFQRSKSESLRDVSVTRIDHILSHGFPETGIR